MEISQTRQCLVKSCEAIRPERTREEWMMRAGAIPPSFQDGFHSAAIPDTSYLADFRLCLLHECAQPLRNEECLTR